MERKQGFFLTILCFVSFLGYAQNKYDWQQYAQLPFKKDSVESFQNTYVAKGVLPPITQSNYEIEIRQYMKIAMSNLSFISTLKISRDSVFIEIYIVRDEVLRKGCVYNFKYIKDTLIRHVYDMAFDGAIDSLMFRLSQNNTFTISDQTHLIDEYKSMGIRINDPCKGIFDCFSHHLIYYELKVRNKTRNFNLLSVDFYKENGDKEVFLYTRNINELLNNLFHIHQSKFYELEKKQFDETGYRNR